ncbi:MAG: T9SS type A sorting domain-containing protein [Bacteroidia bacterium]|nr:T9SS type A sorting domain-containing protein [Bacteroidia bacterium]
MQSRQVQFPERPCVSLRSHGNRIRVALTVLFSLFIAAYGASPLSGAAFLVNSNADATTAPTLRAAILAANLNPGPDTILFALPGIGTHTIFILSQLPQLTDPAGVLIDGFSQPGSIPGISPPSTLSLRIIIDGSNAGAAHGFWIVSPHNTIRGLVVQNFQQDGIRIQATLPGTHSNLIFGNIIGVDVGGTIARGNGKSMSAPWGGVNILVNPQMLGTVFNNTVRCCLISSNYSEGVSISSCPPGDCYFNRVDSNYIGTTISGMAALGNRCNGVYIGEAAHDNQVWDNLISGNDTNGVCIIGYVDATTQWFTDRNIIGRNVIGLAANRTSPLPNGWYGVSIGRYGMVWRLGHARENVVVNDTIAYNGRSGVMVLEHLSNNANADRNRITQNAIYANGGLGIDLDDDGVTPNDPSDPDLGANEDVNFPVINIANWAAGVTTVSGTVDLGPGPMVATVEVFKAVVDPTGYGEGAVYLGSATPGPGGAWSCLVTGLIPGDNVTATVVDGAGNSSEFAQLPGPVVPVQWTSVHAAYYKGVVTLRWITAAELNNALFEIERKDSETHWRCIGSVPGSGSTSAESRYVFTDPLRDIIAGGVVRYRLVQVDYDGTRDYSPEALVELSPAPTLPVFAPVWPNPASDQIFLRYTLPEESEVHITLSDMSGREVLRIPSSALRSSGGNTVRIDTESLSAGCYELICRAGAHCEVQWVRIVR